MEVGEGVCREAARGRGMGAVYLARDEQLGESVALNVIASSRTTAWRRVRFRRWALACPNMPGRSLPRQPSYVEKIGFGALGGSLSLVPQRAAIMPAISARVWPTSCCSRM